MLFICKYCSTIWCTGLSNGHGCQSVWWSNCPMVWVPRKFIVLWWRRWCVERVRFSSLLACNWLWLWLWPHLRTHTRTLFVFSTGTSSFSWTHINTCATSTPMCHMLFLPLGESLVPKKICHTITDLCLHGLSMQYHYITRKWQPLSPYVLHTIRKNLQTDTLTTAHLT